MNTQRTAVKYWGFALAISIFVSLIGYFIHYKWDEGKTKNEIKLRALKEEWPQLKVKFHSVIEDFDQKAKEGSLSSNDLDALFALQKEWVLFSSNHRGVYFPDSFEVMEEVDSRLTSYHGAMLWEESVALEGAAKNIYPTNPEQASAIAESIDLMKQALEKQRFINDDYPNHEYSNLRSIREPGSLDFLQKGLSYRTRTQLGHRRRSDSSPKRKLEKCDRGFPKSDRSSNRVK